MGCTQVWEVRSDWYLTTCHHHLPVKFSTVLAFSLTTDHPDHGLKTLPTERNCKVLASISLATYSIKRVGRLSYHIHCCSLIFTRALNSQSVCTKISSHQTSMDILQDVSGGTKGILPKQFWKCIMKHTNFKGKPLRVTASWRNLIIWC